MADAKISQLTPVTGADLQDDDLFVVARSTTSQNFSLRRDQLFLDAPDLTTTSIQVTNIKANDGTASATIADSTGVLTIASSVLTTTDINGGTIDGTVIGGAAAAAGTFTNVTANGTINLAGATVSNGGSVTTVDINGGTIDGTVIGGSTPAAISGTTGSFTGNLTLSGTARRITGDMSNATISNRVAFQSSTVDGNTSVVTIPNGTSTNSNFAAFGSSDPNNSQAVSLAVAGGVAASINSVVLGTPPSGTFLPLVFNVGGAESMRITSTGNVGIGTSGPAGKFNVGSGRSFFGANSEIYSIGVGFTQTRVNSGQTYYIGATDSDLPDLVFSNAAGSERMRITSTGNVGIGTSSPAYPLHVSSATTGIAWINSDNSNTGAGDGAGFFGSNNGVNSVLYSVGGSSGVAGTTTNHPFVLVTNNLERMRITSTGNVGIGTSSPAATLDVNGQTIALSGSGTADRHIEIGAGRTGNGNSYIDLIGDTTHTDFGMRMIRQNDGANGTSSVQHRGTGALQLNAIDAGFLQFSTGNTERARIDASGNVGINTTSTGGFKFAVAGTAKVELLTLDVPNTTTAFVGMGIANRNNTGSGGTAFIDSQGQNNVTDSHFFFRHFNDHSSDLTFATQPSGTNTDRRVSRVVISSQGHFHPDADNAYECGISVLRWSAIWAANGTIQTSDARAKTEISDSVLGLDFISSLRPVSYKWVEGGKSVESETTYDENGDPVFNTVETSHAGTRTHFGLIAQEVKDALPEGVDFGGWVLTDKDNPDSQQALRYDQFIAPLIKAVQQQQAIIEALEARITALEA